MSYPNQADAQQQYRAEQEAQKRREAERTAKSIADSYGIAGTAVQASGCAQQESLRTRINRRASDAHGELTKYGRAGEILSRHPEFEEFLELLRLIPQSEWYR